MEHRADARVNDHRDLRSWLATLADEGELMTVDALVECGGEIQEIARQQQKRKGPAFLLTNIIGHEETRCRKLFVGSLGTYRRVALAMRMESTSSLDMIVEKMRSAYRAPLDPINVPTGPVKENVITGSHIDLGEFPAPLWHPHDGARYINTWAAVVTRDPETGAANVGAYRGMIRSRDQIGVLFYPTQGWGVHYRKYVQRNMPMPVAIVYGWDPSLLLAAAAPLTTTGEWQWMGALRGAAVPLVQCETSEIGVPASAEIVVEGFISPDPMTFQPEGPFKEGSGCYGPERLMPVVQVSCITHRDDPIMVGSATGLAPIVEEQRIVLSATHIAAMRNALDDLGVPGVLDLKLKPFFAVKIDKAYQGHAYQVASALFGFKGLNLPGTKMLVVVEGDVDLTDPGAILAAINRNTNPVRDVYTFPTARSLVDSSVSQGEFNPLEYGGALDSKLLIDATTNWLSHPRRSEWQGERHRPAEPPPVGDVEKVKRRWSEYGFGEY